MPDGTGLDHMEKAFPDRFYDVGIAEEHAVTFAAGMATQGVIPVVAIYSTFMQRAFDQIIHDVALQKLHVVFVLDRAGLVGADGPTHHGTFDLSFLRQIPGMTVMAPKDEAELRDMLHSAVNHIKGPVAIRYPRGTALGVEIKPGFNVIEKGCAETLKTGSDICVLAVGSMVNYAMKAEKLLAGSGVNAQIVNMRYIKPIDENMLNDICKNFNKIVTIEENSVVGGFGSAVAEFLTENNYKNDLLKIGIPDKFVDHGTQAELHKILEMDPEGIAKRVLEFIK
jgi:1-deoxy-D-xylulose-5-phosphate synthase